MITLHTCHWPGCKEIVQPRRWGCIKHWAMLPKSFRDEIWRTYVPGQEITKRPSARYVAVAQKVQDWIRNFERASSLE